MKGEGAQVVFTGPEQAELLPSPPDDSPLKPDEVRGRTLASIISAGTELAGYTDTDPKTFPRRPGYGAVFVVEAVGEAVEKFEPGDTALSMGPHRSWQRVGQANALPVPSNLRPEEAVFARLMGVSLTTLATTKASPGQGVLVTGLGPVGHLAAKIFAACGYSVLACDPADARRDLLSGVAGITTQSAPPKDAAEPIALAVECSGHEGAALDACRVVQKGGEVVLVGVPWQKRAENLSAHDVMYAVFHRYIHLRSGWEWELPRHAEDFRPASIWGNLALALRWLAEGRVSVAGLYETTPPAGAQEAYTALRQGRAKRLATVFDWRNAEAM